MRHYTKGATAVDATITRAEAGGFTAVASTASVDRDGEVLTVGCFNPLPASIKVHLDHVISADNVVATARPYYRDGRLMIDATFGSDARSQAARQKVAEGLIDSVSVVFLASEKREVKGVPTVFKAELLACDLVSVPSQPDARILSSRGLRLAMCQTTADARADALLALAEVELAEAKALLGSAARPVGQQRRRVAALLRDTLAPTPIRPTNYDPRSL